jgi:hypothetical protein
MHKTHWSWTLERRQTKKGKAQGVMFDGGLWIMIMFLFMLIVYCIVLCALRFSFMTHINNNILYFYFFFNYYYNHNQQPKP